MDPNRFERISELFAAAVDLPAEGRSRFLDEQCGGDNELKDEVEQLIALDDRSPLEQRMGSLDSELGKLAVDVVAPPAISVDAPEQIGGYRILGELGSGGMGIVYRAEQAQPKRTVALKLIRSALDERLLRRFEQEAEVLGLLHHPGIAQIFEASTARTEHQPVPFFVMELVDGQPLNEFAMRRALDVDARVRLLIRIGEALQHAHQKGVIHRDLKPANVLVTGDGQPKILDFGVARATDADLSGATLRTDAFQVLGTLPYMSPEQVRGDSDAVDTRSDVYALGVVAFELLTGKLPYEVGQSLPEAARVITEQEPLRLGTTDKALRGDLETIVGKALEKDARRRYQSASEFAADLERFLRHEPIEARDPSTFYQLEKFARRHRGLVVGLSIAVVVLIGGVIGMASLTIRARAAEEEATQLAAEETELREAAEKSRDVASAVNEFLNRMLGAPNPYQHVGVGDREITVVEVLDTAAAELDEGFDGLPDVEAEIRSTLGRTYLNIDETEKAERQFRRVHELHIATHGAQSKQAAEALRAVTEVTVRAGRLDEAEELSHDLIAVTTAAFGETAAETYQTRFTRLEVLFARGQLAEAAEVARETYTSALESRGPDDTATLRARNDLGVILLNLGQLDEAEELQRTALATCRERFEDPHPQTLGVLNNLAAVLWRKGRAAEAEEVAREVVEGRTEVLGPSHRETLNAMNGLIVFLNARRAFEDGNALREEQLTAASESLGDEHPMTLSFRHNYAASLRMQRNYETAAKECRAVLGARRRVLPAGHERTILSLELLGMIEFDSGRHAEAEALLREAATAIGDSLPAGHSLGPWVDVQRARCLIELGRIEEAEQLLTAAGPTLRKAYGPRHRRVRTLEHALRRLQRELDK